MAEHVIYAMEFTPDGGVAISYNELPTDVRNEGSLFVTHHLEIADCPDYREGIEAVQDALRELLRDALDDLTSTEPVDLRAIQEPDPDPDDDD